MSCRLVRRHIGAMVDGELDPATQIEFERHLAACAGCQEHQAFERSMREQVRGALGGVRVPEGLRSRVLAGLDEEDRRVSAGVLGVVIHAWPMRARHAVPLAAAAAAVFLVVGGSSLDGGSGEAQQASLGGSPMLEDVVRLHSSSLPADVPGEQPQQVVRYFDDKVEFPVRTAEFGRRDVRLTGARLANVRDRRAAALYYDVRGRRMTMVVFQAPARPLPTVHGAARTARGGRDVSFHQVRGQVVPVRHHQGLSYAMTGDLSRKQLVELAELLQVRP
ncbi:MAG: anti-sigma factor family protein [Myxococcota bacterium]